MKNLCRKKKPCSSKLNFFLKLYRKIAKVGPVFYTAEIMIQLQQNIFILKISKLGMKHTYLVEKILMT